MNRSILGFVLAAGLLAGGQAIGAEKKKAHGDGVKTVAYLGVATESVEPNVARHLKLRPGEGLEVQMVDEDSPAAGQIREDDILKELNGQWLVNPEQLRTVVRLFKPGEEVAVTLIREGETKKVTLKLGSREITREEQMQERMNRNAPGGYGEEDLTPLLRQFHGQNPWGGMGRGQRWQTPDPQEDDSEVEQPAKPRHNETHVSSSSSYSENGRTVTLTEKDGDKQLKVTKDGKTEFDGPVNTEKQIDGLEKEIRELYEKVAKQGASIKVKTQRDDRARVDI